jgi:hypothetical protein
MRHVLKNNLVNQRIVNPPRVRFAGVGAEDGFRAGLLILTLVDFLLTTFIILLRGGRVEAALHLPAQLFEDLALGPLDEAPTLGVQAEIGIAGIGISPSKPGMGATKLFRACKQAYEE